MGTTAKKTKHGGKFAVDIIVIVIASSIFAVAVHSFFAPVGIAPGGITGLSVVANKVWGIGIGLASAILNIPLIILGFIFLGKKMMFKTVLSVIIFTVAVDFIFAGLLPVYHGETILSAIFGGALMGSGLGLVYTREAVTGGTDIVNKIIAKFFGHIKFGNITFVVNLTIISLAVLAMGDFEVGLFSIVTIFVSSKMIDGFIYGMNESKLMLIISEFPQEISAEILKTGRGITLLKATGLYTGNEKNVLLCAVLKNEYFKIKNTVKNIDKKAFIIVTGAGEVFGEGFKD
jgi:uncharacterized membrane-anchored protein YitT (DUF2179 family)